MAKKRPRFLPAYVTAFDSQHGTKRYRFRRKGYLSGYFTAPLGSDEFRQQYAAFMEGRVDPAPIGMDRHAANSVADLIARFASTPTRLGPSKTTQVKVRAILGRFQERYGSGKLGPRLVTQFTFEHIDHVLEKERVKRPDGRRQIGGIEAARKLRKELVRLFDFAEKIGMRPVGSNPVRLSQEIRQPAGQASKGHHTWTEEEIARYRATHVLGTRARLALELLLWTGQRRGDGYRFGPDDVRDGFLTFTQGKGGKDLRLPVVKPLVDAITAMPPLPAGASAFLLTERGAPFSYAGFGNKMREWCDAAGLPHCTAHGLRKANARRLAELGASQQSLKAVGGWSNDREVAIYTRQANQAKLAEAAMTALAEWEAVSHRQRLTGDENV